MISKAVESLCLRCCSSFLARAATIHGEEQVPPMHGPRGECFSRELLYSVYKLLVARRVLSMPQNGEDGNLVATSDAAVLALTAAAWR